MGNIELLRKTKEFMQANPQKHNQSTWISFMRETEDNMCGTTMCTAGHAAVLAGADIPTYNQYREIGWVLDHEGKINYCGNGVASWAAEKLGLNDDEYNYIFFCMDKEELFARIDQITHLWETGRQFDRTVHEFIGEED